MHSALPALALFLSCLTVGAHAADVSVRSASPGRNPQIADLARTLDRLAGFEAPNTVRSSPVPDEAGLWMVDLDGRGPLEVVRVDPRCGHVDCEHVVFRQAGQDWQIILRSMGAPEPLETRHNGWLDISATARISPYQVGQTTYRFDANRYVPTACGTYQQAANGSWQASPHPCPTR